MKNWIIGLILLALITLSTLIAGIHYRTLDFLQIFMLFFSYYGIILFFACSVIKPREFEKDENYSPFISIIVPARNEEHVIEKTVRSLLRLDYYKEGKRNYEILIMDDNSQDKTLEIAQSLQKEFEGIVRAIHRTPDIAGKGKALVLNHGLQEARGEGIAVFDADSRIEPDFFKKMVPYMAPEKVAAVQGRVRIYNKDVNILTSLQDDEFTVLAHVYQLSKELIGGMTGLSGNGQIVKKSALDRVGAWNWLSPTEDMDLTFKFMLEGLDVRYCPHAVLYQEAVDTPHALLRQRVRWAEGFLKCIFDYTHRLFFAKADIIKKADGYVSVIRVIIPFFVWVGYIYGMLALFNYVDFTSTIPPNIHVVSSWVFYGVMVVAMWRFNYNNLLMAGFRAFGYSFYAIVWLAASPLAFINCIRHIRGIYWDKTEHKGRSFEGGESPEPEKNVLLVR